MAPSAAGAHTFNVAFPNLKGKHWTEPEPPKSDRFMADVDAPLMEKIFHVPQGKRLPDIQHHRQADSFGAGFEPLEGVGFDDTLQPTSVTPLLKASSSDRTLRMQDARRGVPLPLPPDLRVHATVLRLCRSLVLP